MHALVLTALIAVCSTTPVALAWAGDRANTTSQARDLRQAGEARGEGTLRRNGEVSRRMWTPEFARGRGVSVGLALGLRGPVRQQLDRPIAPALTVELGQRSSVSLIGAPGRGAMLVWQTPAW